MKARRVARPRVALIGVVSAALLTVGCRVGNNPARAPAARSPSGIIVGARWDVPTTLRPWSGEVLGFDERGVYLLHGGAVALYPFGTPLILSPDQRPPSPLDLRSVDEQGVEAFALYARYPFGLDDALLGRVLGAIGLDSVIVRNGP
jgi:hypothetical protein